jgi:hypothetical protein
VVPSGISDDISASCGVQAVLRNKARTAVSMAVLAQTGLAFMFT